jgi:F-type H+-transporting ATPase subunit a
MEKLEHPLWIVEWVNALLGPLVAKALKPLGYDFHGGEVIPPYLVMTMLIVAVITIMSLVMRSRLSVENPSRFQIILEDAVLAVRGLLVEWIGPEGAEYLPLIFTFGIFILLGNYAGLVPGLTSPTSSINVTLGCAITTWVYYHVQGIRKQGILNYLKHFAMPPGVAVAAPVRQHLRRGNDHPDPRQHRSVHHPAAHHVPRADHRRSAGVHLRAAVHHLSAGGGCR